MAMFRSGPGRRSCAFSVRAPCFGCRSSPQDRRGGRSGRA
jgi:hypothetical protein